MKNGYGYGILNSLRIKADGGDNGRLIWRKGLNVQYRSGRLASCRHVLAVVLAACSLFFVSCHFRGQSSILMAPYLQAVTTTSIDVLVESSSSDPVTVDFGTSPEFGSSAGTLSIATTDRPTFVHTVMITGLQPNTQYYYRVRQGVDRSADATFRTAPQPGTPFRFAWEADFRGGRTIHDSITQRIAGFQPVVILMGGDIAATTSYDDFKNDLFRPLEQALISHVPFFNAPGNHEGWTTNTRAFTRSPASAPGSDGYYSTDYGDLHVLVLNTQLSHGPGSPQYAFAAKDLSSTKQAWKIVIAHKPAYCAGGHGEESDMVAMSKGIFEPDSVIAVIAGHTHFYQHNLVNGVHHLVIGTAGAPLYTPESRWYTIKSAREYNFAIGDVTPVTLRLMVYNEQGSVLDSLVLEKPRVNPAGAK